MAVPQHGVELLESYLDDALDMSEVEALQTRLARETELASAMTDIRAQRALRKSIFTSFEPSEGTANAVVSNVLTATIARKPSPARRRNPAWYYATAAACLAIGFLGRGVYDQSQTGSSNLA